MKRVILARLAPLIERLGQRAYYRVVAKGDRWMLLYVRRDDSINPDDWRREAGE